MYHNLTHSALPSIHMLKCVSDSVYAVDEECTVVKLGFFSGLITPFVIHTTMFELKRIYIKSLGLWL